MKVRCIDVVSPRSDQIKGRPTGITAGCAYEVAEVLDETQQYSIINDDMKMSRYSQYRFLVIDPTPIKPLRENFNMLTLPLRTRIKELEKEVAILKKTTNPL